MERELQTVAVQKTPLRIQNKTIRGACLVHIYPTGANMGNRYNLTEDALVIGRSEECDICIDDSSVSRRHAQIELSAMGHVVVDLGSTNGTFVNDVLVGNQVLKDGDSIYVGNGIFRYLAGGNVEREYHEEIYRLTILDALTTIHNKRFFLEFLDRELARSSRHQRPLTLILFDIDRFKMINDNMGHLCGDYTLRELATHIKGVIRRDELFARYGGEEFAIVLPDSTREQGVQFAERIRRMVEERKFQFDANSFPVTISLGVATTIGDPTMTCENLIYQADEKLYQAKREGRNRVKA